ncbi:hypothetical protein OG618_31170 [Kitasatospora sp. NBC_01246]|uniref:hypothetical protein n=1 Tax=Kitasatospora sp. NBC_01246 TaxID=2903570 RepID=UPI002E3404E5|nr:hypothetical protein [Kitasatospora sp. NBC_01246]
MARGKLWGYVASGARALGGFGAFGAAAGGGRGGGPGAGEDGTGEKAGFGPDGFGRPPAGVMAGPRELSSPELERLRWTDRAEGCGPRAPHVQVADVVQRVLRGGGRAGQVAVRIPAGLPVVVADARRLESALAGLVDHAIRRSPWGARVLVRADVVDAGAVDPGVRDFGGRDVPRAGAGGAAGAGAGRARVELRVVDRGQSELPEARQWLLAGLRSAGAAGPAVDGLVRAAGGRLAVEQTPGGGLTVVLALSVARE